MDGRTLKDGTMMIVQWDRWMKRVDPNATEGLDSDENLESKEGWQTIRKPYQEAADMIGGIEYLSVKVFRHNLRPEDEEAL